MDKVVDFESPILLMQRSPQKDKKMLFYENMWHNVVLEPEIQQIIPEICKWIKERQI